MESVALNPCFDEEQTWGHAKAAFLTGDTKEGNSVNGSVSSFADPFPSVVVKDFIQDPKFLSQLSSFLLKSAEFEDRNNDLFQFRQTKTLLSYGLESNDNGNDGVSSSTSGSSKVDENSPVEKFARALREKVKPVLEKVSGIELNDHIFMSSSIYEYTDTLLCHDDDLEERRIAFIYYLTPEGWTEEDGGMLDLFSCTEKRWPGSIVRSFLPERNSFAFFHVSYKSFHQVREVLAKDKTRLSLNGWFHGAPLKRPPPPEEVLPKFQLPGDFPEEDFFNWINPSYLNPEVQHDILMEFGETSELRLASFLNEEIYEALCEAIAKASGKEWVETGPVNRRKYRLWDDHAGGEGSILAKLSQFLQSEAFFLALGQLTGLELHPLIKSEQPESDDDEEEDGPGPSKKRKEETGGDKNEGDAENKSDELKSVCHVELREMSQGSYTLMSDNDPVMNLDALEVSLFFNIPKDGCELSEDHAEHDEEEEGLDKNGHEEEKDGEKKEDYGGYLSYVPRFETDELLRITPTPNTLAMVFRTKDTLRFTKFVNDRIKEAGVPDGRFHHVLAVYLEDGGVVGVPGRRCSIVVEGDENPSDE